jgi:hypothetical protein
MLAEGLASTSWVVGVTSGAASGVASCADELEARMGEIAAAESGGSKPGHQVPPADDARDVWLRAALGSSEHVATSSWHIE